MATKDCNICGKSIDSHKMKDITKCVADAGYIDYTGGDDGGALALAKELNILQSVGQPHQDKTVFQIYFKGSKTPVETIDIAETVYRKCLTKMKPQDPLDELFKAGGSDMEKAARNIKVKTPGTVIGSGPFKTKTGNLKEE